MRVLKYKKTGSYTAELTIKRCFGLLSPIKRSVVYSRGEYYWRDNGKQVGIMGWQAIQERLRLSKWEEDSI